jgi:hypothetical protein
VKFVRVPILFFFFTFFDHFSVYAAPSTITIGNRDDLFYGLFQFFASKFYMIPYHLKF